ncbi:aldehyde dehydrogenase family protein [Rhodococcoides kyotonense]|uniref:aldehyde dehydrogenase family protein n=1 Tax=Rhodococcoides kyotonense TaxID=398843 RepID=UPI00352FEFF4
MRAVTAPCRPINQVTEFVDNRHQAAVLLEASELKPLAALMLARLSDECGPSRCSQHRPGLRSQRGSRSGTAHRADKIALIGAVETGHFIGHAAVDTMKRVSLELGGNRRLSCWPTPTSLTRECATHP